MLLTFPVPQFFFQSREQFQFLSYQSQKGKGKATWPKVRKPLTARVDAGDRQVIETSPFTSGTTEAKVILTKLHLSILDSSPKFYLFKIYLFLL